MPAAGEKKGFPCNENIYYQMQSRQFKGMIDPTALARHWSRGTLQLTTATTTVVFTCIRHPATSLVTTSVCTHLSSTESPSLGVHKDWDKLCRCWIFPQAGCLNGSTETVSLCWKISFLIPRDTPKHCLLYCQDDGSVFIGRSETCPRFPTLTILVWLFEWRDAKRPELNRKTTQIDTQLCRIRLSIQNCKPFQLCSQACVNAQSWIW